MRTTSSRYHGAIDCIRKIYLRSNSLCSTERKLFYPSIPVIMRHTRNMVGYASGSRCSLIFYITLLFVLFFVFFSVVVFFFTISNKERVYSIISHFFTINNKLSIYNVVSILFFFYNQQLARRLQYRIIPVVLLLFLIYINSSIQVFLLIYWFVIYLLYDN